MTSMFSIADLKPLVIGRGPVRLEALEVFAQQGVRRMGMLLSKKDAYGVPYGQAPELRALPKGCQVHLISDYKPADKNGFIAELVSLCAEQGYNAIFAGYGFFAEDPTLAEEVQAAGLYFIGPSAHVSRQAGSKDIAKQTAKAVGASVVPGENHLLGKAYVLQCLQIESSDVVKNWDGVFSPARWQAVPEAVRSLFGELSQQDSLDVLANSAQQWLESEWREGRQHLSDQSIFAAARLCIYDLWRDFPEYDLRIKAVQGGGGKGQRLIFRDDQKESAALATAVESAFRQAWAEVGVTEPGPDQNCVIELNIPLTRHWEIQLVGNGQWCVALGGRDCSVQRFEQKLVEFSLAEEGLEGHPDQHSLQALEAEAIAFGAAVQLDSVSTYEAIVSVTDQQHFFMEVNTRLQVEHRVTELLYALEFATEDGVLRVESLIHLMCILAMYGEKVPKPTRHLKSPESLEVRINSMNDALKPAVGSFIQMWSAPIVGEVRDDQGISRLNPDSGTPMPYVVSGAYDSNLALSLVAGQSRQETVSSMIGVLSSMRLYGRSVDTNIAVLIGVLATLKQSGERLISTAWIVGYLDMAAALQEQMNEHKYEFLSAHRVIAWYFEQRLEVLWDGPGTISDEQQRYLQELCRQLAVGSVIESGQLVGPKPTKAAELVLDPPPSFADFAIRAPSGGVFYAQPAPDEPEFVQQGQQVKQGATLGIIEVMKMFNPLAAPHALQVEDIRVSNGETVQKGQVLMTFCS